VADAVADLHHVFATCPRPRHIIKPVLTARGAAAELRAICARDLRAGLLFGPERAGLDNDDMAQADALVRYPLNPGFMSLNLAQAVMVMAYEWWMAADATPPRVLMTHETRVATKGELENFLAHLVDQLDACGFLRNRPKRPGMVRNIRHFFQRGEVTEQELRTLHGVVTELAIGRRVRGRLEPDMIGEEGGSGPIELPREAQGQQPAQPGRHQGARGDRHPAQHPPRQHQGDAGGQQHAAHQPAGQAGAEPEPEDVVAAHHATGVGDRGPV
jgi:TrmH family RNA methyltransferase